MAAPYLVHKADRSRVEIGQKVKDRHGEEYEVTGWQEPHSPASTGRVYVTEALVRDAQGYYPSVFDMEWEGRTDR